MKVIISVAVVMTAAILIYNPNPNPPCDITIKPDSTWQWRTVPMTNCDFPTWGVFHPDGTWDTL